METRHVRAALKSPLRKWLRGDSHYARPETMTRCERNRIGYVFGLAGNPVLLTRTAALVEGAAVSRVQG